MAFLKKTLTVLWILALIVFSQCDKKQNTEPGDDDLHPVTFERSSQSFPDYVTNQIGLGDFDGDGDLDAVFSNMQFNSSKIYINDGSGRFTDSGQQLTQQGHGVGVGDLDGDNDLDLFITCAHFGVNNVWHHKPSKIYINNGQGQFQDSGQDLGDNELSSSDVQLIDIDTDGDLDAHVSYFDIVAYHPFHKIYLNDGHGQFSESNIEFPVSTNLSWEDLDQDGDTDVFVRRVGAGFFTMLNDGTGQFSEHWNVTLPNVQYGMVGFGDFDNDGDFDALMTNGLHDNPNPTWLFYNDGTGRFTDSGTMLDNTQAGWLLLGDLDDDGFLDVFVNNIFAPNKVWMNDGSGRFEDSGLSLGGDEPSRKSAMGDLDGDGDLDIFVAYYGEGSNSVWLNR